MDERLGLQTGVVANSKPAMSWMLSIQKVGERVAALSDDAPENQWNSTEHPMRGRFFGLLQTVPLLFYAAVGGMAISEVTTTNNNHYFSLGDWWIVTLALAITEAILYVTVVGLSRCKQPLELKKTDQHYPPPLQKHVVHLYTFLCFAGAWLVIFFLNRISGPTDIEYTRKLLQSMVLVISGAIIILRDLFFALRSPIVLKSITTPTDTVAT